MKRFIAVLAVVAFMAIGATVVTAGEGPETVTFEGGKMGQITFPHHAHQGREDCTVCHHNGVEAGACRSCHGVKEEAPKPKDAFHAKCRGCHQETGGPTSCKDCHKK